LYDFCVFQLEMQHPADAPGTDTQQQWNQGTAQNIGPKRMEHVQFKRHKASQPLEDERLPVEQAPLPPITKYLSHDDFKNVTLDSQVGKLAQVSGSLMSKLLAVKTETAVVHLPPHGQHTSATSRERCHTFFDRFVDIDRNKLDRATKSQSDSKVWHDARKIRITASSAKKVPVKATTVIDLKPSY
jgi:hypothetical protein